MLLKEQPACSTQFVWIGGSVNTRDCCLGNTTISIPHKFWKDAHTLVNIQIPHTLLNKQKQTDFTQMCWKKVNKHQLPHIWLLLSFLLGLIHTQHTLHPLITFNVCCRLPLDNHVCMCILKVGAHMLDCYRTCPWDTGAELILTWISDEFLVTRCEVDLLIQVFHVWLCQWVDDEHEPLP